MRTTDDATKAELDRLTHEFFSAVSFEEGDSSAYEKIASLFIESGLLIKNSGPTPEVSSVPAFIQSRQAMFRSGELTRFREVELWEKTEIFGNVAQRFNAYAKSGTLKGMPLSARGMISIQFVKTLAGWRMSSMAWDDERPGLAIPAEFEASVRGKARSA